MAFLQVYGYHDFDNATLVLMRQFDDTAAGDEVFETGRPVQPALVKPELGDYLTRPFKEDHDAAYFDADLISKENRLDKVDFSTVSVNLIRSGKELSDDDYEIEPGLHVEDDFYEDVASGTDVSFMYAVATNRVVDMTNELNSEIYNEAYSDSNVDYFSVFGKDKNSLIAIREDVANQRFEIADVETLDDAVSDQIKEAYEGVKSRNGVPAGKLFTMRNVTFTDGGVDLTHTQPMDYSVAKEYMILTSGITDVYGHDMGVEEQIWENAENNRGRVDELNQSNRIKETVSYDDLDL